MKNVDPGLALSPEVIKLIRRKAYSVAGRYGFRKYEVQDIEQELLFHCWTRLERFDPSRSSQLTFFTHLINHRIATMIQYQASRCRSYRVIIQSLDEPIRCHPKCDTGRSGEACRARFGLSAKGDGFQICPDFLDQEIDIKDTLSTLPKALQDIAQMLLDSANITEIAGTLLLSRSTAYRRILQLRLHFERAGIRPANLEIQAPRPSSRHNGSYECRSNRNG